MNSNTTSFISTNDHFFYEILFWPVDILTNCNVDLYSYFINLVFCLDSEFFILLLSLYVILEGSSIKINICLSVLQIIVKMIKNRYK